ncbi:NAD+ synthase [Capillimicrobium parvum]|uniref:Glutamine-dependent NAD(+) synthetase n=1 Tax=Capillimicrobium parvum TaxID=2884022 RepID=A0A9E6XXT8_9ACTN|nr:NAD+ synthase [Capillimicrobium parvum]UGS36341.1 Glutamine-dependent NAD(+) synthetase [Capillimicrobium parvum]
MSDRTLRLALHQLNPTVGDLEGNERKVRDGIAAACAAGAQLSLFAELVITGYPPEDLLLKEHFLRDARAAIDRLAAESGEHVAVVGFPERAEDVFNAAAVLSRGRLQAIYRKVLLPNYGVFDEQRYFQIGPGGGVVDVGDLRVGITICEDIWEPGPPATDEAVAGASLILNLSASPYHAGKGVERERMIAQRARDSLAAYAFCAQVGGQDELVFDGHSFVCDHTGEIVARAAQFAEEMLVVDVDLGAGAKARLRDTSHRPTVRRTAPQVVTLARLEPAPPATGAAPERRVAPLLQPIEAEVYAALVLGLRDYVEKNGFRHVVLGLSGGIDSALVAAIAVDALGAGRVTAVVMPSPYSSSGTQDDARDLARELGIECHEFSIAPAMESYTEMLAATFQGREPDITEENLQARIRGNLLMALSNKFGWLVLTTGNKSEMSVGYSTLYGDLAGGFAVIKDCPKTLVYRLSEHRGLPRSIIDRPPSAELRPDQRDEDSLPPYELLDRILEGYVEQDLGTEDLVGQGLPEADVERVIRLVDLAEYKRRQAPPGIKITTRAFGRDRRMPITNGYRG